MKVKYTVVIFESLIYLSTSSCKSERGFLSFAFLKLPVKQITDFLKDEHVLSDKVFQKAMEVSEFSKRFY